MWVAILFVAILLVAAGAVYWSIQSPPLVPGVDGTPRAIGVAVNETADGTNWTLTFTSVPAGLTPSATLVTLLGTNGATLLPATALSSLPGGVVQLSGSAGKIFLRYQGVTMGIVYAGDVLSIGTTFAGTTTPTQGCVVQISAGGDTLHSGALQTYP